MPAFPPVPNVLKCSIQHLNGGVNVWTHNYLKYSGTAPATSDAAAIANSIKSAWVTNLAPLCSSAVTFQLCQVTDLSTSSGAQNQSTGTSAGTRTGSGMPADACILINNHIARRYRGGKPRQYWPFGVTADIGTGQTWLAAFTSTVSTNYNAYIAALTAITWTGATISGPVNVSYFQGFTVVTSPTTGRARNVAKLRGTPAVDTITTSSVNARIATQRRRQHFSA